MKRLAILAAMPFIALWSTASAHETGVLHAHPHGSEFAVAAMIAIAVTAAMIAFILRR